MIRDQRQRLCAVIGLQQSRIRFDLIKEGAEALSVDGMIVDNQNLLADYRRDRWLCARDSDG